MLTISNSKISIRDGLYSLNDLHKASGGDKKHQANNFMRLENTKKLIAEIERSSDVRNGTKSIAYNTIQGGESQQQGTFVCLELVYSYAMWISPRFQILVIRAFHAMTNQHQQLSEQLDKLCFDLSIVDDGLTKAGRFLSIGGKQIKPKLKASIDDLRKQMQLSLKFKGDTDDE